jgi:hypothetical protein
MTSNTKITEIELIASLREKEELLAPMQLRHVEVEQEGTPDRGYDAHLVASLPDSSEEFRFLVEVKSSSKLLCRHGRDVGGPRLPAVE